MKLATVLKTTLISVLSLVFAVLTSSFETHNITTTPGKNTRQPVVRTVVIDPGHGGKDPGCHGKATIEKDIALSIGLRLGEDIKKNFPDVKVIYTRSTDVFIPLDERAQIANKADADLFISIHCNFISKRNQAQGSETYVMGLHRAQDNLDVAKRENAVILMEDDYIQRYDGYDPNSPEGHIILSMYQNAHLDQSILFADYIEKQFFNGLTRKSRGVKQAGFVVLRNTTMPSVLVETGFLSHDDDEAFLGDKTNHAHVAEAIFKAFSEYKAYMEGYALAEDNPVASVSAPESAMKSPPPAKPVVVAAQKPVAISKHGITFFVQLAASKTPLKTEVAQWNVPVFVETRQENGYYKYLAGPFTEAGAASALQKELRSECCKDAFVVAYRDNQRISLTEAEAFSK